MVRRMFLPLLFQMLAATREGSSGPYSPAEYRPTSGIRCAQSDRCCGRARSSWAGGTARYGTRPLEARDRTHRWPIVTTLGYRRAPLAALYFHVLMTIRGRKSGSSTIYSTTHTARPQGGRAERYRDASRDARNALPRVTGPVVGRSRGGPTEAPRSRLGVRWGEISYDRFRSRFCADGSRTRHGPSRFLIVRGRGPAIQGRPGVRSSGRGRRGPWTCGKRLVHALSDALGRGSLEAVISRLRLTQKDASKGKR